MAAEVDPSQRQILEGRVRLLRALLKAVKSPERVVELAAQSANVGDFCRYIMVEFDVGKTEAHAIADMQLRRLFKDQRSILESDLRAAEMELGEE